MIITAPAKVNLYLKVLNRRNDGYHEIETIFEKISLFDEIDIEVSRSGTRITCDDPSIPVASGSLMARAVRLFKEKSKTNDHFQIKLKKNIPTGGGLGGGSSDAAAVLRGLNKITGERLSKAELCDIAPELGSDVSFFVNDVSFACGKGRGDIITELRVREKIWHVLVTPPFEILTKDIYSKLSSFGLTKDMGLDRMVTAFSKEKNIENAAKNLRNDLQPIALREFPLLKKVFRELKNAGAFGTLLSGSGSTVFGIFDKKNVKNAAEKLRLIFPKEENWRIYIVSTY